MGVKCVCESEKNKVYEPLALHALPYTRLWWGDVIQWESAGTVLPIRRAPSNTLSYTLIHTHTHTYICVYIYTYIHIHVYTHTHKYECA